MHTYGRAVATGLTFATAAAIATHVGVSSSETPTQANVTVNVSSTLQQIDGFGISQAFGGALQLEYLDSIPQRQSLDYLFSTTTGAGLTIIRNRIGSGGYGDSILPNSPGSPSGTPQYVWNQTDSGQVWFSQQAMSYGVNTIYATAWSAPGFMKTNGNQTDGGYLCGITGETCSSGDWRQAYANMLVQYVQYYKHAGINITHLGFLNEPDYACVSIPN
jgi:O-glycosyl hydrolase